MSGVEDEDRAYFALIESLKGFHDTPTHEYFLERGSMLEKREACLDKVVTTN